MSAHLYQYRISSNLTNSDQKSFSSQSKFQRSTVGGKASSAKLLLVSFYCEHIINISNERERTDTLSAGCPCLFSRRICVSGAAYMAGLTWHTTWQGTNSHDAWHSQPASLMTGHDQTWHTWPRTWHLTTHRQMVRIHQPVREIPMWDTLPRSESL